jgi:8-amino-7-oxononanoate synthase
MARPALIERLAARHHERSAAGLARVLRTVSQAHHARVVVDGRELVSFASNDYLGLAGHPALTAALVDAAARWGVGATAAHLLGGHRAPHAALEAELAAWTGYPRALLFSTGYMANLGICGALLADGDVAVQDKLNHACLIDGARLAGATLRRYVHADVASARRQLAAADGAAALLATDGVFSMDGDVAPLAELAALAVGTGATLVVDDAHGLGVLGADGAGSVAAAGLGPLDVPVYMGTLGKALGGFGAFVAGEADLVEGLVQFARTHVYTTALPPALAAAVSAAVGVARNEGWRRDKLTVLVRHFRRGAAARGLALLPSPTPIQPVLVGSAAAATRIARALELRGFHVPAIRPPTVPTGQARLRVSLSALHAESDVEALLDALAETGAGDATGPDAHDPAPARDIAELPPRARPARRRRA